ncbi:amino acid adenylation domain-containing protein [Winogradskya humida]|uniref:D-alanine--poly(Phosphoribitol) ligase n=1 Tax=Winogradskya humida TaxID=113566 RepID=A0ABQ3ZZ57_9ACTN|nr:amino acid adenylation domain-containing protein [Actinoplanes humidus]GIE23882.1 D-alanine--poly(phosphoribitol) ligase [Actinoplanes humidus]
MTARNAAELLIQAARHNPAAIALRWHGVGWTYGELYERVGKLTDLLLGSLDVATGDRVGVLAAKSPWVVAAGQAVLRADAVCVMLDVRHPIARLTAIIQDCGITTMFVDDAMRRHEDALRAAGVQRLVPLGDLLPGAPARRPAPVRGGTDLALLLYTSGSTGLPKAVGITHENVTAFVDWAAGYFGFRPGERFLSQAHLSFDISTLDIFNGFACGACVVLLDESDVLFPRVVVDTIRQEQITNVYVVSSALASLAGPGGLLEADPGSIRRILYGGEVLPAATLTRIRSWLPDDAGLYNVYGPLETNIATIWPVPTRGELPQPPPIGCPVPSLRVEIRREDGIATPEGEQGEIWIAGPTTSSGYWNRPEQNELRFVERDGVRWYRTGDRGSVNSDGRFDFHGRGDDLVKRRGYRIELGEIETAIAACPGVAECAVVATSPPDGPVEIHAWFVAAQDSSASVPEVRRFLTERVPGYMFPDSLRQLSQLPKTARDKIDRGRLRVLGTRPST